MDHFVSSERAIELMVKASPGTLLAFDEAQHFSERLVDSWCAAADGGAEILIASPSAAQLCALNRLGHRATRLRILCQACEAQEAARFFCFLEEDRTESLCEGCYSHRQAEVENEIVEHLRRNRPRPGENWTSQPVELPACASWRLTREDSRQRFHIMHNACAGQGLPGAYSTYLDIGCKTGYFCSRMAQAGFKPTGIDTAANDIEAARLLGTFFRHDYATYVLADIHEYMHGMQDHAFDVASAFSGSQRAVLWGNPEKTFNCLRELFRITGRICVLEPGGAARAEPADQLDAPDNIRPVYNLMQTEGGFERIDHIDRRHEGLMHDLLIGYKPR